MIAADIGPFITALMNRNNGIAKEEDLATPSPMNIMIGGYSLFMIIVLILVAYSVWKHRFN